jgi:hypothetical protein
MVTCSIINAINENAGVDQFILYAKLKLVLGCTKYGIYYLQCDWVFLSCRPYTVPVTSACNMRTNLGAVCNQFGLLTLSNSDKEGNDGYEAGKADQADMTGMAGRGRARGPRPGQMGKERPSRPGQTPSQVS